MLLSIYTNVAFGTDESVLNSEVSSFQRLLSTAVVKYTNVTFGTDERVLFLIHLPLILAKLCSDFRRKISF